MNAFSEKFKLLYIPFLLISLGFIVVYTGIHWLLLAHWHVFQVKARIIDVILPVCLPWLPILLWYNRRVKTIRFGYNHKDGFVFQVIVWGAIALPALAAQFYLEMIVGTMQSLADIPLSILLFLGRNARFGVYGPLGVYLVGAALIFFLLFFVRIDEWDLMRYRQGMKVAGNDDEISTLAKIFQPKKDYFFTPVFLDINLLVFIAMVLCGLGFMNFRTYDLLLWGGNFRPVTSHGQWWRLLTATFLHGGLMHLVSNMVSLVFIGVLVEPAVGRWRFAFVYLVTGICASLNSLLQHEATVSVGASGAIFGLYGLFIALMITRVFPKDFRRQFLRMTLIFIIYNLAMGATGNIDNAAHLGGLVSGIALGIVLSPSIKKRRVKEAIIRSSE